MVHVNLLDTQDKCTLMTVVQELIVDASIMIIMATMNAEGFQYKDGWVCSQQKHIGTGVMRNKSKVFLQLSI